MSVPPTADEIFEMAEQIERNGARFYRRAAQGFTDSRGRQLMLDLATMEDQHEKVFAGMRAELLQQEREPPAAGSRPTSRLLAGSSSAGRSRSSRSQTAGAPQPAVQRLTSTPGHLVHLFGAFLQELVLIGRQNAN
jgi:hypothetical protein